MRRIISILVLIIGVIALFFLIRAAINGFSSDPKPTTQVQTEGVVSDPAKGDGVVKSTTLPATNNNGSTSSTTSTSPSSTANPQLANTGPAETATAVIAITAAVGTTVVVRRRQLARV